MARIIASKYFPKTFIILRYHGFGSLHWYYSKRAIIFYIVCAMLSQIFRVFDGVYSSPMLSSHTQVIGRLFAPSQKLKKWTQRFRQCFELVFGILNAVRKIFLVVYGPIFKLQGFECVRFQGKNCVTKMVSNFSEINSGLTIPKKMNKIYQ